MVNLVSPGAQVTVTDESFSVGAGQGTVPMLVVATRANKATPDGTGIAFGTTSNASNRLFLMSSQRELLQTFGLPQFKSVGGSAVNGDPTNEYGLLAAHSFLGISNRALILRADVDLGELDPQTQAPTGPVADLTYWVDLNNLKPGLFVSTAAGLNSWQPVDVALLEGVITPGSVEPSSGFVPGDVVLAASTTGEFAFFEKISNNEWQAVQGTAAPFNQVPSATAANEYWLKTTPFDQGASIDVKVFDAGANRFVGAGQVLILSDSAQYYSSVTPANQVAVGTLAAFTTNNPLKYELYWHNGDSTVSALGVGSFGVGAGVDLTINGEVVQLGVGVTTVDLAVQAINFEGITNVVAFNSNGQLRIVNTAGEDLVISSTGSPTGIPLGVFSNWILISTAAPAYEVGFEQPVGAPVDGTLWYDPGFEVDLLVRGASGWEEVAGDITVDFSAPAGAANGDIWISTADLDNYPLIYRRIGGSWVLADNSDQTTTLGVLFADYRVEPGAAADPDAPPFQAYPQGMLLWNTRYSSRNVKQWSSQDGVWKSVSGVDTTGSLITGQRAVRAYVANKMAQAVATDQQLRSDVFYNLTAAPGFPELAPSLTALSVDRKQTVFVIADTPFDLVPTSNSIQEWSNNFPVASENVAVYYPSGLSRNLDGTEVVVPASHMVLRTFAFNDQVAYPWFAPAGFQRGIVNNASAVGYLRDGEFVSLNLSSGQRDVLYLNRINPLATFPGQGIVIMGQKTRLPVEAALDRVNVARLVNYVRLQAEQLAEPFLFQPNDSQTRLAVRDRYESFLSTLVTLRGLTDFLVVCDESNNTPDRIDRNELWVDIAIAPTRAVEFILIPIRIRNTGADLSL